MILRRSALFFVLFSLINAPLVLPLDNETGAAGRMFQLVTKEGKVVAEFSITEGEKVLITLENGVPHVRNIGSAAVAATQPTARDEGRPGSDIERAKALLQKKDYGAVIALLSDKAFRNPNDFQLNLLLARAEVEKCEQQKESDDNAYKTALRNVYQRGQRLYNMNRSHPEPYYIVAKSLYLNDKAAKAYGIVRKAVYYEPLNPYYQLLYGDLIMEQAATWKGDRDGADYAAKMYKEATAAYEKALLYSPKNDNDLGKKLHSRIERVDKLTKRRGL